MLCRIIYEWRQHLFSLQYFYSLLGLNCYTEKKEREEDRGGRKKKENEIRAFENDWKQDGIEKYLKKNDLRNAFHVTEGNGKVCTYIGIDMEVRNMERKN